MNEIITRSTGRDTIRCGRCGRTRDVQRGSGETPNFDVLEQCGWTKDNGVWYCYDHAATSHHEANPDPLSLMTGKPYTAPYLPTPDQPGPRMSTDSAERKEVPMARGLLDYFPDALAEVARLSQIGNDKHNPGEDLHHARGKSMDHADCIMRHLVERGTEDTDGLLHDVKVAWRALAMLQEELERQRGLPLPRGARG